MGLRFQLHQYRKRPVVAILTMDDGEKNFRGNRNNFLDLLKAGKRHNVLIYVTTVKLFNLDSSQISGYTYDFEQEQWIQQMFPQPHVVYNRIPYRRDELVPEAQQTIEECLRHVQIKLFNPSFFNKWELFEWLNQSNATRKFIPITVKLNDDLKLLPLLKQYPVLYLKPEKGKAGSGIMRIRRVVKKKPNYLLSVQIKKKSRTYRFATLKNLKVKISEVTGQKDYIIQQGIGLVHNKKRPFDLRVLVQKNYKGLWAITGIGGRVAGELSITTHVPRGGSIDSPQSLLNNVFGATKAKQILFSAKKASLSMAKQIEKASGQMLGEMSMDLGVDDHGNVWFFEANAKPMKFDEPDIRKKSLDHIIKYCIYLANSKKITMNG